jgi:hypothetical protein
MRTDRLFLKTDNAGRTVHLNNTELAGMFNRTLDRGYGQIRTGICVLANEIAIVGIVNMIAGEDEHEFRTIELKRRQILKHSVCRTLESLSGNRRKTPHKIAVRSVRMRPSLAPVALDVGAQIGRPVLREQGNAAESGMQTIEEREIDDSKDSAESDQRLRPQPGQGKQAFSAASSQYKGVRPWHRSEWCIHG